MILELIIERGNIIYKSKQLCAYADHIILVTRNFQTLQETEGRKICLIID
jgi:hypothetical protein